VRRVTLATTDGFGIYARTRHPDQAWELLKFLISPDYGRAMAQANFLQPARASLVQDWVNTVREQFPQQAQDLDIAAFADGQVNGYSVTAEIFPDMTAATRLAQAAWQDIFVLGQAPVERMVDVAKQIEAAQPRQAG
jgi:multiple sugar transport system substrate-binding protein